MSWQQRKPSAHTVSCNSRYFSSARLASGRSDISSHVPATIIMPRHTHFDLLTLHTSSEVFQALTRCFVFAVLYTVQPLA